MIQNHFNDIKQIYTFLHQRTSGCRVMVVGDIMLDRYYFGEVNRISPEAPVPVAQIKEVKERLGGAANVSHNLARLGCQVELIGITGNDYPRTAMINLLSKQGISAEGLIIAADRPTTSKTRVLGGHQQILRLDFEDTIPIGHKLEQQLQHYIMIKLPTVHSIIVSDYGKGVCTPKLCQMIITASKSHSIPLIIDPKGADWRKYKGAFLITPNLKELSEAVRTQVANEHNAVEKAAQRLRSRYQLDNVMATRSEKGLSLITEADAIHVPTTAQEVFDVSGAGDTVVAVMGAALADGMIIADAAQLANVAAGIVVGKLGTYAISQAELLHAIELYGRDQAIGDEEL